jgi:hypothetical protein
MTFALAYASAAMLVFAGVQSRAASRKDCVGKKGHEGRDYAMRSYTRRRLDERS